MARQGFDQDGSAVIRSGGERRGVETEKRSTEKLWKSEELDGDGKVANCTVMARPGTGEKCLALSGSGIDQSSDGGAEISPDARRRGNAENRSVQNRRELEMNCKEIQRMGVERTSSELRRNCSAARGRAEDRL